MFNLLARPSAGIGVVEVQKPMVFCDFQHARATLCGDRRGRGAKTHGFLRFLRCSHNPLRGSAWSKCKNPCFFFAISNMPARPSAGIGVVEVQKLEDCHGFCCSNWSSGVVSWFARLLPEPALRGFDSSLVRGRASQDATCILKQLAQSNLRRASCTTCAEQLAQSNLHSATCVEQLAQTNLHRPVCAEHLAWCCLALASRMLRVGKKNASCSVGPASLAMFCFRANRGLVVFCTFLFHNRLGELKTHLKEPLTGMP